MKFVTVKLTFYLDGPFSMLVVEIFGNCCNAVW